MNKDPCPHTKLRCKRCLRDGDLGYFIEEELSQQVDANDLSASELTSELDVIRMEEEFREEIEKGNINPCEAIPVREIPL